MKFRYEYTSRTWGTRMVLATILLTEAELLYRMNNHIGMWGTTYVRVDP